MNELEELKTREEHRKRFIKTSVMNILDFVKGIEGSPSSTTVVRACSKGIGHEADNILTQLGYREGDEE